jgi:hypothetical protein
VIRVSQPPILRPLHGPFRAVRAVLLLVIFHIILNFIIFKSPLGVVGYHVGLISPNMTAQRANHPKATSSSLVGGTSRQFYFFGFVCCRTHSLTVGLLVLGHCTVFWLDRTLHVNLFSLLQPRLGVHILQVERPSRDEFWWAHLITYIVRPKYRDGRWPHSDSTHLSFFFCLSVAIYYTITLSKKSGTGGTFTTTSRVDLDYQIRKVDSSCRLQRYRRGKRHRGAEGEGRGVMKRGIYGGARWDVLIVRSLAPPLLTCACGLPL